MESFSVFLHIVRTKKAVMTNSLTKKFNEKKKLISNSDLQERERKNVNALCLYQIFPIHLKKMKTNYSKRIKKKKGKKGKKGEKKEKLECFIES